MKTAFELQTLATSCQWHPKFRYSLKIQLGLAYDFVDFSEKTGGIDLQFGPIPSSLAEMWDFVPQKRIGSGQSGICAQ